VATVTECDKAFVSEAIDAALGTKGTVLFELPKETWIGDGFCEIACYENRPYAVHREMRPPRKRPNRGEL